MKRRCRETIEGIPDLPAPVRCELPRFHWAAHQSKKLLSAWEHTFVEVKEGSDPARALEIHNDGLPLTGLTPHERVG